MKRLVTTAILILSATAANAHVGVDVMFGSWAGFSHPFHGPDHLAAMVVVGMLAVYGGGARVWFWPVAFVSGMIMGALLAGVSSPFATGAFVQAGIAVSLVAAAGAFLAPAPIGIRVGGLLVAAAGVFHGLAHGAEAPGADFPGYVAGFVIATALLHVAGIAVGFALARSFGASTLRSAGIATAAVGAALATTL